MQSRDVAARDPLLLRLSDATVCGCACASAATRTAIMRLLRRSTSTSASTHLVSSAVATSAPVSATAMPARTDCASCAAPVRLLLCDEASVLRPCLGCNCINMVGRITKSHGEDEEEEEEEEEAGRRRSDRMTNDAASCKYGGRSEGDAPCPRVPKKRWILGNKSSQCTFFKGRRQLCPGCYRGLRLLRSCSSTHNRASACCGCCYRSGCCRSCASWLTCPRHGVVQVHAGSDVERHRQ